MTYKVTNTTTTKGSWRRRKSVSQEEYDNRWDAIFGRDLKEDNTGTDKNEYQDELSTEDCILDMPGTVGSAKLIFKK
jgi:hypothetical protein